MNTTPVQLGMPETYVRMTLSMIIAGATVALAMHAQGQPVNVWFFVGVAVIAAKDGQSFMSRTWAIGTAPDAPPADAPADPPAPPAAPADAPQP